jgi:hypothetical protein
MARQDRPARSILKFSHTKPPYIREYMSGVDAKNNAVFPICWVSALIWSCPRHSNLISANASCGRSGMSKGRRNRVL